MIVLWRGDRIKVLGTELFAQHNIADLNSDIAFIVLLSEEKPLP